MLIRDIKRALHEKLSAQPTRRTKHEHYAVFDPDHPTRKLCTVYFSHGQQSIDDESLLRHIAVNELHLQSLKSFSEFVACTLDGQAAFDLIRNSVNPDLRKREITDPGRDRPRGSK